MHVTITFLLLNLQPYIEGNCADGSRAEVADGDWKIGADGTLKYNNNELQNYCVDVGSDGDEGFEKRALFCSR